MRPTLSVWTNPWRPDSTLWMEEEEANPVLSPACEIDEHSDYFAITLDVPGVDKKDIKLEFNNGHLSVSAERKQEKASDKESTFFSERRYGRFERVFELGEKVDPNKIEANYQDGVLKIHLGKAETSKPRQIEVKGESTSSKTTVSH